MMSGVTLSKHAKQRMEQRRVSIHNIVRTLAFGEAVPTRQPAIYRTRIPLANPLDQHEPTNTVGSVVVVYQQVNDSAPITIITVY